MSADGRSCLTFFVTIRYALAGGTLDETTLLDALRPPVARVVFDAAVAEVVEARTARVSGGSGGGGSGANEVMTRVPRPVLRVSFVFGQGDCGRRCDDCLKLRGLFVSVVWVASEGSGDVSRHCHDGWINVVPENFFVPWKSLAGS